MKRCRLAAMVTGALLWTSSGAQHIAQAANSAVSAEDEQAKVAAQFLKVLLANPRFGTAFDRVREFHLDRGSIAEFEDSLCRIAGLPLDEKATVSEPLEPVEAVLGPDGARRPGVESAAGLVVGMLRLHHSQADSAIVALQWAAEQRQGDPVVHWYLARALVMAGRTDDAVAAFETAMACRPQKADFIEICRELARTHQRAQNSAAAVATWQRLENEFPGDLRVKEQIAAALADEGRWQDSLTRFETLVKETKDAEQRVQANLSASDLLIQLSRPDDAVRLLESQLGNLDTDSWLFREIRRRIEGVFRSRDDLDGLTNYYDAWIKAHPEDVDAMVRMARILSLRNQSEAASEWYSKALKRAPSNVALRESLIEQLVRDRKVIEAIAQYEQLAQIDAGNPDHIEEWGQLYLSRTDLAPDERRTKAAAVWETLLVDRNEDPSTLARVAGLMRRAELTDRAITLYQLAIEKAPDEPQYREYLGEYLHRLQRADEALATWTAMAEGGRRTRSNLVRLAEVLHSFGVFEPALDSLREACGLDPELSDRHLLAEMLREAAERLASDLPADSPERHRRDELIAESLSQLTLAEGQAESSDEFQQILNERIKTLIVAGQLEQHTAALATELAAGINVSADRWRTLSLYQDAAEKMADATVSALRVVELEPQSTAGWAILADLYERTGRLGDAADAMRKLASLDRRGISEILKKIARLEVRLGRFEQALQAGRDVIRATPGNPEAYQFFADLCFEVGKPDDAMDALRQAVRVNPGDEASLRALAKTLADEFHTAEAIELYWRAFDKASELESQTSIVVVLSHLYLRMNQFERLIQRLDLRARELNLPREMTRHIATACREAGEFRKARESLERLLIDDSQNVSLLKELVSLAEREHNPAEAEDYQRQIVAVTGSEADQRKLLQLLRESGSIDQAQTMLQRLAETRTNRAEILREVDELFENRQEAFAADLCRELLNQDANDWEAIFRLAVYYDSIGKPDEALQLYRRMITLPLDFETPSYASANNSASSTGNHLEITPAQVRVWNNSRGNPRPRTFGTALLEVCRQRLWSEDSESAEDAALIFSPAVRSRHGLRIAACLAVSDLDGNSGITVDERDKLIEFLRETPGDLSIAMQMMAMCGQLNSGELPDDECTKARKFILDVLTDVIANSPEWISDPEFTSRFLVFALIDNDDAMKSLGSTLGTILRESRSIRSWTAVFSIAAWIGDERLVLQSLGAFHKFVTDERTDAKSTDRIIDDFPTSSGVEYLFHWDDPEIALSLLSILTRRSPAGITSNGTLDREFGPVAGEIILQSLQSLASLDAMTAFDEWIERRPLMGLPNEALRMALLQSEMWQRLSDPEQALYFLICAAEAAPQDEQLRLSVAETAYRMGHIDGALLLLQSMNPMDPAIARDQALLELRISKMHGRIDVAETAARKLFGLPLSTSEQLELIPVLSKLGMHDKVAAIEARLGRGSETRQSILGRQLQTYIAQGKDDLAGEAAWELLELASDGSLFSGRRPSDDRDDGGERLQAIKALGRLNRLQPIIDRYEEMLVAAPDSVELLEILAEFHEAAEQWPQLTDKRDRIALLFRKAPPSLRTHAIELERSGDTSGACDLYLQILRSDPQAFAVEMETYLQSFERAGRLEDFLNSIAETGLEHFQDRSEVIVSAASLLKKSKSESRIPYTIVRSLLSSERHLSQSLLLLLLQKPELIEEEELAPFVVQMTLLANEHVATGHMLRLGEEVKSIPNSILILRQLGRQESLIAVLQAVAEQLQEHPELIRCRTLIVYLEARIGHIDLARRMVRDILADIAMQRYPVVLSELQYALSLLEGDWTIEQIGLLQHVLHPQVSPAATPELMDESARILGTLYEQTGRTNDARLLVLSEVQRAVQSLSSDSQVSEMHVRRVLSSAERIQHSGYPIDAISLLQSVTAHEVDQFADDLGEDKAIAFKSRFSASDRWARQQISAEKLVEWYAMAVEQPSSEAVEDDSVDLLLELTGTTNPVTREESELKRLGLNSVLLSAIAKNSFDSAELREQLTGLTAQVLALEKPDVRLLAVTAAFALRTGNTEQAAVILARLQESNELVSVETAAESVALVAELVRVQDRSLTTPATGGRMRIPEALRSQPAIGLVMLAKLLAGDESRKSIIETLLIRCAAVAHNSTHRLVRTAVLNECFRTATVANLPELAGRFERESAAAIREQIESSSVGSATTIDIAHEIRTRLLKQP